MNTDQIIVTTQARRITRFANEADAPGWVGHFDPAGRFMAWVCGPAGGARLKSDAIEAGYVLVRVSNGRDTFADVQRQINSQRAAA